MKMDHLIPKRGPVVRRRRQAIQQRLGVSGKQARRLMRRSFLLAGARRKRARVMRDGVNAMYEVMTGLPKSLLVHPERAPRGAARRAARQARSWAVSVGAPV